MISAPVITNDIKVGKTKINQNNYNYKNYTKELIQF